jgi:hypothetical protein
VTPLAKPKAFRDGFYPDMVLLNQIVLRTLAQPNGSAFYEIWTHGRALGRRGDGTYEFDGMRGTTFNTPEEALEAWQTWAKTALPTARFPWVFPLAIVD